MKFILLFLLSLGVYAGTCTSDSYTSASANSVLTSTKYNSDHSTIYNRLAGNLDGGCITDSTVEKVALNSSEFAPLYDSFKDGCKVTRTDAATLSIGSCRLAVDGEWVNKTTATSVTWGCGSCASEVAATQYYLYVADGSTGSTLTPLISTTAPTDGHGEDGSNNKVIARFYNNASSDIDQYSIDQWKVNSFEPQSTGWINAGVNVVGATTTGPTKGTTSIDRFLFKRVGGSLRGRIEYKHNASAGSAGSGDYLFYLPNQFRIDTNFVTAYSTVEGAGGNSFANVVGHGQSSNGSTANGLLSIQVRDSQSLTAFGIQSDNSGNSTIGYVGSAYMEFTANRVYGFEFDVPILGWGE